MKKTKDHKTDSKPLHIHEDQVAEKRVVVHQSNEHLFVLTGKQMIESCQLVVSIETWLEELRLAKREISEWSSDRSRKYDISCTFLIPRPTQLAIYVVRSNQEFDFDLASEASDLVLMLTRDYQLGTLEFFQIPADEAERFIDVSYNLPIYGEYEPASSTVEA